jgi:hypothetical protein
LLILLLILGAGSGTGQTGQTCGCAKGEKFAAGEHIGVAKTSVHRSFLS